MFYTEPQLSYYWGKVIKTFAQDEDADIDSLPINFLKQKNIGSDPSQWTWQDKKAKEVTIVEARYILYGPVIPDIKNNVFIFPDSAASLRMKNL